MNKKLIMALTITLSMCLAGHSQKVKFKKGKVLIDGKAILKYEKRGLGSELTIFSLENDEEIGEFIQDRNGTNSYQEDDFKKLYFVNEDIKIESSRIRTRGWKYIIKILVKDKVINMDGMINLDKLKKFAKKYDENITNRTIRY